MPIAIGISDFLMDLSPVRERESAGRAVTDVFDLTDH